MSLTKNLLALAAGGAGLYALRRTRRPDPIDLSGRSVLITGGSRGLGLALARTFANQGARLTLLARDESELHEAEEDLHGRGADVFSVPCDVSDPVAVRQAVTRTRERRATIDVLVNCAGVIQTGPLEHMKEADFREALDVHFWGAFYAMREVVPEMRRRGSGRIVNISSIGGLVAVPHLVPYSASKFALTGLSDGMRAELARHGVRVTTVCPGLMRTGSHRQAWFKGQHAREFGWFAASASSPLFSTSAGRAAREIVRACRDGRPRLVITPQARLLELAETLTPNLFATVTAWAARLLPAPAGPEGDERQRGYAARPDGQLSWLTWLGDRASRRYNEMHES